MGKAFNTFIRKVCRVIPDKLYLTLKYRVRMGKWINWKNPKTFNEKLQWLKLYDRQEKYISMVDKYEAKKYVASIIGDEYIIPTLGVWERFDEIDFSVLPNQFVLKCTHDSGGLIICKDKSDLDIKNAQKKIESSLRENYFWAGREWPYKGVKPRIIAEKYMEDNKDKSLTDYKFFCFNGTVRFLYISKGLENHSTAQISFLSPEWDFIPAKRSDFRPFDTLPPKPVHFEEMARIAEKLSAGHTFLRVDMYELCGKIYFSELTFFPCGGMIPFEPISVDDDWGKLLSLPD